jgi:predicted dehydrogenase
MIHSPADDARFKEVESTVSFTLRFASGVIANCASSYSLHETRVMSVIGSKARARIDNAFAYQGQQLHVSQREGDSEVERQINLGAKNQFALEMDHLATCIRNDTQPRTPGEEGLQDQVLMAAIYEAARTGQPVKLPSGPRVDAYRGPEPGKEA